MKIAGFEFRPSLIPTLATIVGLCACLGMGNWQLHRAAYKRGLARLYAQQAAMPSQPLPGGAFQPQDYVYRRVRVTGVFDPAHQIYLDNQVYHGQAGYHVLAPLRIPGSTRAVVVDRGWVPVGANRRQLPSVQVPAGPVTVEGIAVLPPRHFLALSAGPQVSGRVWENLVLSRYAKTLPYPIAPIEVQQLNDTGDGLKRQWVRPDTGVSMHLNYAGQWFLFAATLLVIYIVVNAKRIDKSA